MASTCSHSPAARGEGVQKSRKGLFSLPEETETVLPVKDQQTGIIIPVAEKETLLCYFFS